MVEFLHLSDELLGTVGLSRQDPANAVQFEILAFFSVLTLNFVAFNFATFFPLFSARASAKKFCLHKFTDASPSPACLSHVRDSYRYHDLCLESRSAAMTPSDL
jgi:hypothetical protein